MIGGEIAAAVAAGRRAGKPVLVVGGTCDAVPGIMGGLQQAHGPAARIGLVWFDAHGDFNTPGTTLSGMLGGMPVAVAAGLALPRWRRASRQMAPLPTDRIVMVDVRNLDPAEEQLIRATDVVIAAPAAGFPGQDLRQAIADLADALRSPLSAHRLRHPRRAIRAEPPHQGAERSRAWSRCWPRSRR